MDNNAREVLDAITKAKQKLSDLCHGRERWHMSIPADPENDPDIVIMEGLHKAELALAAIDAEKPATWEPSASKIMRERLAEMNVKLLSDKYDKSDRKRISEIVKDLEKEIAELDAEEIATCEAYYEKKRAKAVNDFRMDELDAVMISVDKFLTGDALKNNPATRAADAREIALQAIEKEAARADRAEKALKGAADRAVAFVNNNYNERGEWDDVAFDNLRVAIMGGKS